MWDLMPESYMKLQDTELAAKFEIQMVRFFFLASYHKK